MTVQYDSINSSDNKLCMCGVREDRSQISVLDLHGDG